MVNYILFLLIVLAHEIAHLKGYYYSYKKILFGTPEKFLNEAGNNYEIEIFGKIYDDEEIVNFNLGKKFFEMGIIDKNGDEMKKFFSDHPAEKNKNEVGLSLVNNKDLIKKNTRCLYTSYQEDIKEILKEIKF